MNKKTKTENLANTPAYQEWFETESFGRKISDKSIREKVKSDIDVVRQMDQKEYTLYQKWDQIQTEFKDASKEKLSSISQTRDKIWIPNDPLDYQKLEPEVVFVKQQFPIRHISIWGYERYDFLTNPDPLSEDWVNLRYFASSHFHGGNVGKELRFLIRDKKSKKYIGILSLAGDYADIKGRDDAIGWTRDQRTNKGMLEHTAVGSVIVPTQPFGYNYVGGKLLSLLLISDPVKNAWEQIYNKKLVGITTTALYGTSADQYSGLKPHWAGRGESTGSTAYRPTLQTQELLKTWMKQKHPEEYYKYYKAKRDNGQPLVRDSNERARQFCYKSLGITDVTTGHKRKAYFAERYSNSFEFLREEISEKDLKPRVNPDYSTEYFVNRWKSKWVDKRVKNLVENGSFKRSVDWYDAMISLSWDQVKGNYL